MSTAAKGSGRRRSTSAARLAIFAIAAALLAFVPEGVAQQRRSRGTRPPPKKPVETRPASQPAPQSASEWMAQLEAIPTKLRTTEERALLVGLDFVLAVATRDGRRAVANLDAPGYQALPLEGPLPADPDFPLSREALEAALRSGTATEGGALSPDALRLVRREAVAAEFPAVARWMLPDDFVLLAKPIEGAEWPRSAGCVVVRVRGARASIVAGNLVAQQ